MSAVLDQRARVEEALRFIPPDLTRELWWKIAAALKSEFGDAGFELFDTWSQGGTNYTKAGVRETWKSTREGGEIRIATLFFIAKEHGYDPKSGPKPAKPDPEAAKARRQRIQEDEARAKAAHDAAAKIANAIYADASRMGESGYLKRKGIKLPEGVRFVRNLSAASVGYSKDFSITALVVPLYNAAGSIRTVQFISDRPSPKNKSLLPGGQKSGCFFIMGVLDAAATILICEGMATGASLHEATGFPVVVAFDCGNLQAVAATIRAQHATAAIIVAGDALPAETWEKAQVVARQVGGTALCPPGAKDFNDMHQEQGLDAVRAVFLPPEAAPKTPWRMDLRTKTTDAGNEVVIKNKLNISLILSHHEDWAEVLAFDSFRNEIILRCPPPIIHDKDSRLWDEVLTTRAAMWLEREYFPAVDTGLAGECIVEVAQRRVVNDLRDYFMDLPAWDGIDRLRPFWTDAADVPQTAYSQAAGVYFWSSMAMRALHPGCQADMMVVLESAKEGIGKTSLLKRAVPVVDWFLIPAYPVGHPDFFQSMRGKLLVCLDEMDAMGRAEVTTAKRVLTQGHDTYRPSYGRNAKNFPRMSVFAGTTNRDDWNHHDSGGRRFLPIKAEGVNLEYVEANREQLFAQALAELRTHPDGWWKDIPEDEARSEREARMAGDSWADVIRAWLADETNRLEVMRRPAILDTTFIFIEILGIKDKTKHTKADQMRIANIMRDQLKCSKSRNYPRYYILPPTT
jgi:putative DNA primase/helicase